MSDQEISDVRQESRDEILEVDEPSIEPSPQEEKRDAPAAVRFAWLHARNVGTVAGNLKSRSLTGKPLTTWEKRTPPSKDNIWRKELSQLLTAVICSYPAC